MKPWEIHPALVHFPIAFLVGAAVLDVYALKRSRPDLVTWASRLFQAGAIMGVFTALAGLLAFFTVPGHHPDWAHDAIVWHLGLAAVGLVLVSIAAWLRRGVGATNPTRFARGLGLGAVLLLGAASWIGGTCVYHGGMGIDPEVTVMPTDHHHP